ncbi:hypothetical protein [Solibacillus sp. CAU 1738]|uniref:hypothetical protein n=1 Tax=Solibacillus sp. CAU 1738 TaxID=3140363 RepID=UPI00325FE385
MVKYYYDKYNATPLYRTVAVTGPKESTPHLMGTVSFTNGNYKDNPMAFTVTKTSNISGLIGQPSPDLYCMVSSTKAINTSGGLIYSTGNYWYNGESLELKSSIYSYARGSLVSSNIQAEDGTYPVDGRHTDGYWYVRKTAVNTAPTWKAIPTQSTTKNVNKTVNLASYASDADSNTLTYSATSNNTGVATVTVSGSILSIKGIAKGTATITVTANDGKATSSTTFTVNVSNTGPTGSTIPTQSTKKDTAVTLNLANYFSDIDGDALSFTASSSSPSVATASVSGNTLTITGRAIGSTTITVNASDTQTTAIQSFTLNVTNTAPTVSVSVPTNNVTLYENDLLNLTGSAADVNANQSVTVYAQVNLEQRIVLAVGLSNAPIPFNKQLKFKGGQLYDGDVAITNNLTDGVPHTLKIWAQDGDGGQSTITERTFYVVPNRPPILTVDTVQPGGIINKDKFTISGGASDPDGNSVTAAYKINGGNSVPLEIIEGKWAFEISLFQLLDGLNTIVIELSDSYNFKVSKIIKLNKNEVKTPILHSVARYKIEPPKGTAKGVLLWIQRDEGLQISTELSMTLKGEQELFVPLVATNTAPVSQGIVEDEFYHETLEPKENIILKISMSRSSTTESNKINLISGVLE